MRKGRIEGDGRRKGGGKEIEIERLRDKERESRRKGVEEGWRE